MKSHKWDLIAVVVGLLLLASAAHAASLTGDQISVRIQIPTSSNFDQTQTTTVAPGDGDTSDALVFTTPSGIQITVDPNPTGFNLTNTGTIGVNLTVGASFTFSDLDFSPPAQVTNVSYTHNWVFINAETSWTPDSASIEFTDNSAFSAGNFLSVSLQTGPPDPVPAMKAPGAIALLLVMLVLGGLSLGRTSPVLSSRSDNSTLCQAGGRGDQAPHPGRNPGEAAV